MSSEESQKYVSPREAAMRIGYTSDYVTRLAREGKIAAQRNGKKWIIDLESLKLFSLQVEADKRTRSEELREERLHERYRVLKDAREDALASQVEVSTKFALLQTVAVVAIIFVTAHVVWFAVESDIDTTALANGVASVGENISETILEPIPNLFSQTANSVSATQAEWPSKQQGFDVPPRVTQSDDPDFGGVIFISESENRERVAAIRGTFSDEVEVDFESDEAGVITPVFREREGDSYRFRLEQVESDELRVKRQEL